MLPLIALFAVVWCPSVSDGGRPPLAPPDFHQRIVAAYSESDKRKGEQVMQATGEVSHVVPTASSKADDSDER